MAIGNAFRALLPSWLSGGNNLSNGNVPTPYGNTYRGLFSDWFNQGNIADEDFIRQLQQANYLHNLDIDTMNKANDFSYKMFLAENDFNSREAQKQRDYDERMASSVYTRMVQDLKTAGLNPILALSNGAGASQSAGTMAARSSAPSSANPGSARSSSYRGGQADTNAVVGMISSLASTVAMASLGLYKANLSSATSIYNHARK